MSYTERELEERLKAEYEVKDGIVRSSVPSKEDTAFFVGWFDQTNPVNVPHLDCLNPAQAEAQRDFRAYLDDHDIKYREYKC